MAVPINGCEPCAEIVLFVTAEWLIACVAHIGIALCFQLALSRLKVAFRCAGSEDGDEREKKDEVFHGSSLVDDLFNARIGRGQLQTYKLIF